MDGKCTAATILFFSISGATQALPQYTVTDLGTLGGSTTQAYGINASGQVVGSSTTANGAQRAFMYNGTMHDLGTLGGDSSHASAINSTGQIVGWSLATNSTESMHAFIYDGEMHDLHFPGSGDQSTATGINNAGQIVGYTYTSGMPYHHGFLVNNGVVNTSLGISSPSSINESGAIVGTNGERDINNMQAMEYLNGSSTSLGTLGGAYSFANATNDAGIVVGLSAIEMIQYGARYHAYLYDGVMHDLGTLGGNNSWANGVLTNGEVVGAALTANGAQRAFFYDGSAMYDLNSVLIADFGISLNEARGINTSGQIIASATNGHAYLLSQVPIPASAWLFGSSLIGLAGAAQRKLRKH